MKTQSLVVLFFLFTYAGFSQMQSGEEQKPRNNRISFNYSEVVELRLGFAYERIFGDEHFSLKVPLAFSFAEESNNYSFDWYAGLDFNYYPLGQKRIAYFTGVGLRYGEKNDSYVLIDTFDSYIELYGKDHYAAFYVNNGLHFNFTNRFSMNGKFGFGAETRSSDIRFEPSAAGELGATFRF